MINLDEIIRTVIMGDELVPIIFEPSKNIVDAWVVVTRMEKLGWSYSVGNGIFGPVARFWREIQDRGITRKILGSCFGSPAPERICRAAIEAVGKYREFQTK